jgi:hypothetical protein
MVKTALILLFLAGLLPASEVDLRSPTAAVSSYYAAMNEGDLAALEQTMVRESYDMDVQVYALSIAFKDKAFHTILKHYAESEEAREIVKREVAAKLRNRHERTVADFNVIDIGSERVIVRFNEEGKTKQLYLSRHDAAWKIDYKAGRKTN